MTQKIKLTALAFASVAALAGGSTAASAYVEYENCAANAGCGTSDNHTFSETRSKRNGANLSTICARLFDNVDVISSAPSCVDNNNFVRNCYWGGTRTSKGWFSGTSSASIEGRAATPSDATTC